MMRKKICMLGAFAVGKTSLVRRFVTSIFSDEYLTTLGVKIDKKSITVSDQDVDLILWDLAGEDSFVTVNMSYLKGASGLMFVIDGTRPDTLTTALQLMTRVEQEHDGIPRIVLLNKSDISDEWQLNDKMLSELDDLDCSLIRTSALNGEGVEDAFHNLTEQMLAT